MKRIVRIGDLVNVPTEKSFDIEFEPTWGAGSGRDGTLSGAWTGVELDYFRVIIVVYPPAPVGRYAELRKELQKGLSTTVRYYDTDYKQYFTQRMNIAKFENKTIESLPNIDAGLTVKFMAQRKGTE